MSFSWFRHLEFVYTLIKSFLSCLLSDTQTLWAANPCKPQNPHLGSKAPKTKARRSEQPLPSPAAPSSQGRQEAGCLAPTWAHRCFAGKSNVRVKVQPKNNTERVPGSFIPSSQERTAHSLLILTAVRLLFPYSGTMVGKPKWPEKKQTWNFTVFTARKISLSPGVRASLCHSPSSSQIQHAELWQHPQFSENSSSLEFVFAVIPLTYVSKANCLLFKKQLFVLTLFH